MGEPQKCENMGCVRKLLTVQAVMKFKFCAYGRRDADKAGSKTEVVT